MAGSDALVYPMPPYVAERILGQNRTVFVKFLVHPSVPLRLALTKSKLIFYASGTKKTVVGEAVIQSVEFLRPHQVLSKFGDRLCLDKDEYWAYVGERKDKIIAVFRLVRPVRYSRPVPVPFPVGMAGRYISEGDYEIVLGNAGAK